MAFREMILRRGLAPSILRRPLQRGNPRLPYLNIPHVTQPTTRRIAHHLGWQKP